jgi:hypothetical protein
MRGFRGQCISNTYCSCLKVQSLSTEERREILQETPGGPALDGPYSLCLCMQLLLSELRYKKQKKSLNFLSDGSWSSPKAKKF